MYTICIVKFSSIFNRYILQYFFLYQENFSVTINLEIIVIKYKHSIKSGCFRHISGAGALRGRLPAAPGGRRRPPKFRAGTSAQDAVRASPAGNARNRPVNARRPEPEKSPRKGAFPAPPLPFRAPLLKRRTDARDADHKTEIGVLASAGNALRPFFPRNQKQSPPGPRATGGL